MGSGVLGLPEPPGAAEGQAENRIVLRSKMRQLAQTDVLIVGGGPAGIGAVWRQRYVPSRASRLGS
jgi:alkyl hydroperoxide reductase subunit AhpF